MKKFFSTTVIICFLFAASEASSLLPDEQDPGDGGGGGGGGGCTWSAEYELPNTEKLFSVSTCNVNSTDGIVAVKKFDGPSKLKFDIKKTVYSLNQDYRERIASSCPSGMQLRQVKIAQDCL